MKKVFVVFVFFIFGILAAPALDKDVRNLEINEVENTNELEEIPSNSGLLNELTIKEINIINAICKKETKLDERTLEMVLSLHVIPEDPTLPKYLECTYRKQNYLNDKGQIQFQTIIQFLSRYYKKEDLKVLEVCGQLKQTVDGGMNALNALKCILPKLIKIKEISDE